MGYKILDVKADIHEEVEAYVDALYGYDEDKEEAEELKSSILDIVDKHFEKIER